MKQNLLKLFAFLSVLIGLNLAYNINTEARKQHAAHTHGSAKLDIAIEKNRIDMTFTVPAADALGFEHTPKTAAEKTKSASVTKLMNQGIDLILLPSTISCTQTRKWKSSATSETSEGGSQKETHSEFKITHKLECEDLSKLKDFEVSVFQYFPTLNDVDVTLITDKSQKSFEVSPKNNKVLM